MSRCIEKIELVFENCESLSIPIKRIGEFVIDNIHKDINRCALNSVQEFETADTIFIQIFNRNKTKKLYRICNYNDITAIYLTFDDLDTECYYVNYEEPEELKGQVGAPNENQTTYVTERGDILLTIAKGKTWKNFIKLDDDSGKDDVYYTLLQVEESDADLSGNIFSEVEYPPELNKKCIKDINKKINDMFDYYEDYDKEQAKKQGLDYAIKEIEKLLGELDFSIIESQGAMMDIHARFEEEKIYQSILKFLNPDYILDMRKLNKEACERLYKECDEKAKERKEDNEKYLKQYLKRHGLPYIEEN